MTVLSMYDVTGIQKFIFLSNKLKENVGASNIVDRVLKNDLVDAAKTVCKDKNLECITNWQDRWDAKPEFAFLQSNDNIGAEVVYIGGGKAMIAYRDKPLAIEVTKALSRKLLDLRGLNIVVAHHETECEDFAEDYDKLGQKLEENNRACVFADPFATFAITRIGTSDSYPAIRREDNDFLSHVAIRKRKASQAESFEKLFELPGRYCFPLEIDKMGQSPGNNYAAFVHIDGNDMRDTIKKVLSRPEDYLQAVCRMRELSQKIHEIYRKGFFDILQKLIPLLGMQFDKNFSLEKVKNGNRDCLPIRPLILNGDDITFACHGQLGITLAEHYLQYIADTPLQIQDQQISLSACAGVAIVNTGFPFYRAYGLTEALCSSAKEKARAEKGSNPTGNWLDFHVNYGGVTGTLQQIREHSYNLSYRKVANGSSYQRYHLLWRPWCVVGKTEEMFRWQRFQTAYQQLKKWPRSRLKKLRNTFLYSEEELFMAIEQFKSRGRELPDFCGRKDIFHANEQTPFFDMLELLDLYVELP